MSAKLITTGVWPAIRSAARASKKPAWVAVAYLGRGAAKLLPLPPNSHLVVDASDNAVRSGQTCPAELLKLQRRGVAIYRFQNLHAKIFIFDQYVFVGSANASSHSAEVLQEAVLRVTASATNRDARRFVSGLCLDLLGPGELKRLNKIYRPPRVSLDKRKSRSLRSLPVLRVASLVPLRRINKDVERTADAGQREAERKATRDRGFEVARFYWQRRCPFRTGHKVIQVLRDGRGRTVSPPGNVVHLRKIGRTTAVYVELPDESWTAFGKLPLPISRMLVPGGAKSTRATQKLLEYWGHREAPPQ